MLGRKRTRTRAVERLRNIGMGMAAAWRRLVTSYQFDMSELRA